MTSLADVPSPVRDRIDEWLTAHDDEAPGVVEGLYLVGSVALDDWRPGSDVDVVAVLAEPADDEVGERLRVAHVRDARRWPSFPVDGPYVAWGDLSVPPMPLHRPWALDGVFHHDAECFEINPVVWHVLAVDGIAVRGPDRRELGVHDDVDQLVAFVRGNVDDYWIDVLREFDGAVDELVPGATMPGAVAEWCVLGACRMLVTTRTGEVVSKRRAGELVAEALPDHADMILRCVELRSSPTDLAPAAARAAVDAMAAVLAEIR